MAEVSFPSSQVLEKSSLIASSKVTASSPKSQIHFERSSLAPSTQREVEKPHKPQLLSSESYQVLLIEQAKNLSALQVTLFKFDTEQIEKVSEKIKVVFSKLLEKTNHLRQREVNAGKWKVVAVVMGSSIMISSFFILPTPLTILPTVLAGLQVNFTTQQLVNKAYLLNIKAELTGLDHELMKGKHEQSRLAKNSENNVFSEIEEQIHLLAIAIEKQVINY